MAIREILMQYFKGSCVERVVHTEEVWWQEFTNNISGSQARHERMLDEPRLLMIGFSPVIEVHSYPKRVVFLEPFNRSPQYRHIQSEVKKFLATYLPAIDTIHQEGNVHVG